MKWPGYFSNAIGNASGKLLWRKLQGYCEKMAAASPAVANGALLLFAENRRKQLEEIDNISSKGRIALGMKFQKEARSTFNLNMTDGFALWLTGAWLESMERTGVDAIRTYDTLEHMAHTAERVAYSTQELVSVDEHWGNYSADNETSSFGTPRSPDEKVKFQKTIPQDLQPQITSGELDVQHQAAAGEKRANRPRIEVQTAKHIRVETNSDRKVARSPILESLGMVLFVAVLVFLLTKKGTHQVSDSPENPVLSEVASPVIAAGSVDPKVTVQPELHNDSSAHDVKVPAGNQVSASQTLYLDVLKKVEADHPELNPKHVTYRKDLLGYVKSRMNEHMKEGYPKHKALQIAVRDLEFRDKAPPIAGSPKTIEAPKTQLPALDKGGHSGFDPACRWVTPQEWSCKKPSQDQHE